MKIEQWLSVIGFEGVYEVSDRGRVRSLDRDVPYSNGRVLRMKGIIRQTPLVAGYLSLFLSLNGSKTFAYVHHLVAVAFIGPRPPGKELAHADGDSRNAALENLRYATPIENDADKIAHGTRPQGSRNGSAKLTEQQVIEIRQRSHHGERGNVLAKEYGISTGSMARIRLRQTWRHV